MTATDELEVTRLRATLAEQRRSIRVLWQEPGRAGASRNLVWA
ncbi:hypothetical protein ACWDRB_47450 [Nonomuraea sp. NPDC003707]